jgi:hypothetical protein
MKNRLFCILILTLLACRIFGDEIIIRADGTKVVLFDNFTWAPLNEEITSSKLDQFKQYLRKGIRASDNEIKIASLLSG